MLVPKPVQAEDEPVQAKDDFQIWLRKQEELKKNIQQVCSRYGSSVKKNSVPFGSLMFDPSHQLLFCRNAKVGC